MQNIQLHAKPMTKCTKCTYTMHLHYYNLYFIVRVARARRRFSKTYKFSYKLIQLHFQCHAGSTITTQLKVPMTIKPSVSLCQMDLLACLLCPCLQQPQAYRYLCKNHIYVLPGLNNPQKNTETNIFFQLRLCQ